MTTDNARFTVAELEQRIAGIRSRSGVIRVVRELYRRAIDQSQAAQYIDPLAQLVTRIEEVDAELAEEFGAIDPNAGGELDRYLVITLLYLCLARYMAADYHRGLADGERSLKIARRMGDLELQSWALNNTATHLDALGRYDAARQMMEKVLELYRQQKQPEHKIAEALHNLAVCEERCNMYDQSLEHVGAALQYYNNVPDTDDKRTSDTRASCFMIRLKILSITGQITDAIHGAAELADIIDDVATIQRRQWGHIELARFYQKCGASSQALHHALIVVQLARQTENQVLEAEALCIVGEIHKQTGETDEAVTLLTDAYRLASASDHKRVAESALSALIDTLISQQRLSEAEQRLAQFEELAVTPGTRIEIMTLRGRILYLRKRYDEAAAAFHTAITTASRDRKGHLLRQARIGMARLHLAQHQNSEAIGLLEQVIGDYPRKRKTEVGQKKMEASIIEAHALLVDAYRQQNDYQHALEHSERHHELVMQLTHEHADTHLANYRVLYEIERLQRQQEQERSQQQQLEHLLAELSAELADRQQLIARLSRDLQLLLNKDTGRSESDIADTLRSTLRMMQDASSARSTVQLHLRRNAADFIAALTRLHPNLTDSQRRLCNLIWSGMATEEIASILHITTDSVRMGRKRLRKALELPSDKRLEDYVQEVMETDKG